MKAPAYSSGSFGGAGREVNIARSRRERMAGTPFCKDGRPHRAAG